MTLNEILQPGEKQQLDSTQLQTIADRIVSECSEYIDAYRRTDRVLFRAHSTDKGSL
jgi:hypothetical protein